MDETIENNDGNTDGRIRKKTSMARAPEKSHRHYLDVIRKPMIMITQAALARIEPPYDKGHDDTKTLPETKQNHQS